MTTRSHAGGMASMGLTQRSEVAARTGFSTCKNARASWTRAFLRDDCSSAPLEDLPPPTPLWFLAPPRTFRPKALIRWTYCYAGSAA